MNINIQYIVKFWDYLRKLFKPEREDVLLSKKYTELPEYAVAHHELKNKIAHATNVVFIGQYAFDEGSTNVRDNLGTGSRMIRKSFGSSSTAVRQVVEGQSKRSRTAVEQVSKLCRTSVDAKSNKTRTRVEEKKFGLEASFFSLTNFAPISKSLRVDFMWASSLLRVILKGSQSRPDGNSIGGRKRLEEGSKNEIRSLGNNADDAFQSRSRIKGLTFSLYSSGIPRDWFGTHWPVARLLFGHFPNASRSGTRETPTNEQPISKQGASKDASWGLAGVKKRPEIGLESAIKHQRNSIEKAKDQQAMSREKAKDFQVSRTCFSLFYNQLHTNLYIFGSLLRLRSEWASSLLRVISKGSQRGLEANLRKCRSWSGKGMKLVSNTQSVDQACVKQCICIDQVWIVRKTVPIHALSTLYLCFIYASSILNLYFKGALSQIRTPKTFNFSSCVYMWFCVNNLLGRFKHFLNKMMMGGHDVVNEGVVVRMLKSIQIPLSLSKALKSLLGALKVLTSIRANALLVLMVSMFSLSAQTPRKDSGADGLSNLVALQPGDEIPDAVWDQTIELNYFDGKKKKIKFSDLKGKLIILDFWSTGCAACIEGIPKMEMIQERFKGKVEILMINSKRNKDTPERIKNRFKKYKEDFNYTPTLATLSDDTLFTKLFEHNTLPTQAVLNGEGKFLATTNGSLTDRNLNKVLYENTNPFENIGAYVNLSRDYNDVITDTVGLSYSSSLSKMRKHYLPVGPGLSHPNNNSLMQMGNLSLQNFLSYLFMEELDGFSWNDYVFDPQLGQNFKQKLFATSSENTYWYQLYKNAIISEDKAKMFARQDFIKYFEMGVERKIDTIDLYQITLSKAINKIRTKGKMRIIRIQELEEETQYQNVPLDFFLRNLFCYLDLPMYKYSKESFKIDITLPKGFINWTETQKVAFLKENGIVLARVREKREFPYIYSYKQLLL